MQGKHCMLETSASAIPRLREQQVEPIVVYMRAAGKEVIKEQQPELAQNAKLEEEVDNAADKMMLAAKKELELYSLFFNRIIENSNFDKARDDLVRFIEVESTAKYWGLAVKGFADFGL